jgi:hypothetical protein
MNPSAAGSGFGAMATAFSNFANKLGKEEAAAELVKDQEALDAQYIWALENPESALEGSRTGDWSKSPAAARIGRPTVLAGLNKTTAIAMAPKLALELQEGLLNLGPGEDPENFRKAFLQDRLKDLNPSLAAPLYRSVYSSTTKAIAAHKQSLANVHNGKQASKLELGIDGILKGGGSLEDLHEAIKSTTAAQLGSYEKNLQKNKLLLRERIVKLQLDPDPDVREHAARLAAKDSLLWGGGSVNSTRDQERWAAWRQQAATAHRKVVTQQQEDAVNNLKRAVLDGNPNAWTAFQDEAAVAGLPPNSSMYMKAEVEYFKNAGKASRVSDFLAGRINSLSGAEAEKALQDIFRTTQEWDAPLIQRVAALLSQADEDATKEVHTALGNRLLGDPKSAASVVVAIRMAGAESAGLPGKPMKPVDLLGENSAALVMYRRLAAGDTSGPNLEEAWVEAKKAAVGMGDKIKGAGREWAMSINDGYRTPDKSGGSPLDWFLNQKDVRKTIAADLGIKEDDLQLENFSVAARQYVQERFDTAAAAAHQQALTPTQMAQEVVQFMGEREWVMVTGRNGKAVLTPAAKTRAATDPATQRLVKVKTPPVTPDDTEDVLPTGTHMGTPVQGRSPVLYSSNDAPVVFTERTVIGEQLYEMLKASGNFNDVATFEQSNQPSTLTKDPDSGAYYFTPPEATVKGTRVNMDEAGATSLVFTGEGWTLEVDNARIKLHPNNRSALEVVYERIMNTIFGGTTLPEVVTKDESERFLAHLDERFPSVTMEDDAFAAEVHSKAFNKSLATKYMAGTLSEQELSTFSDGLKLEYARRIIGGAEGPLTAENLNKEAMAGIAQALGYTGAAAPTPNAPTTTEDPETSKDVQEAPKKAASEQLKKDIAEDRAHPDAAALESEMPPGEAARQAAAENNFVANPERLALDTAESIAKAYPPENWRPNGKAKFVGQHQLSKANNFGNVQGMTFKAPRDGVDAAASKYLQRWGMGAVSVRSLMTGAKRPVPVSDLGDTWKDWLSEQGSYVQDVTKSQITDTYLDGNARRVLASQGKVVVSLDRNSVGRPVFLRPMIVIPDNSSAEVRKAAHDWVNRTAELVSEKTGKKITGRVLTRSQNKRGRTNTVHLEPYGVDDPTPINGMPATKYWSEGEGAEALGRITMETFGRLEQSLFTSPHGNGDPGAVGPHGSEVDLAKNELEWMRGHLTAGLRNEDATANAEPFKHVVVHDTGSGSFTGARGYVNKLDPGRGFAPGYHAIVNEGKVYLVAPPNVRTNGTGKPTLPGQSNANSFHIAAQDNSPETKAAIERFTKEVLVGKIGVNPKNISGYGAASNRRNSEGMETAAAARKLAAESDGKLSQARTVARRMGINVDSRVDLMDKSVMAKFLEGVAEANVGRGEADAWAPHIKAGLRNEDAEMPQTGTGDMVTGHGTRLDWPSTEAELQQIGVKDISNISPEEAKSLVNHRVNFIMGQMPVWFDGANISTKQRRVLMKFVYDSPWDEQEGRPEFISDALIEAVQDGDDRSVARIIKNETRIFKRGLTEEQRAVERHAIKMARQGQAIDYWR